jgi:Flp pilus assembly protein TadG
LIINLLKDAFSNTESADNSRKFFRDNAGAVLIGGTIALSLFGGIGVLALDGSQFYMTSHRAELAAESAAEAAAASLQDRDRAIEAAIVQAEQHLPAAEYGAVVDSSDVVIGHWNAAEEQFLAGMEPANAVRVTVRMEAANGNPVPLDFTGMFGDLDASIVVSSVAIAE